MILLPGRRGVAVLHDDQHAVALVEQIAATPVTRPLCQKPPSPMMAMGGASAGWADRRGARQAHPVAEDRVAEAERREVANEWQPMSALMWVGPISRCTSLIAAKTGRSGQPVQKSGGRGGSRRARPGGVSSVRSSARASDRLEGDAVEAGLAQKSTKPCIITSGGCIRRPSAGGPCRGCGSAYRRAAAHVDRLLDIVGIAFFDHQHGSLAGAEPRAAPPARADRRH